MAEERQRSSAEFGLRGVRLHGKPIRHVWIGRKRNERIIEFDDGSTMQVPKRTVGMLARMAGFLRYQRLYEQAPPAIKRRMSQRSAAIQRKLYRNLVERFARGAKKREARKRMAQVGSLYAGHLPADAVFWPSRRRLWERLRTSLSLPPPKQDVGGKRKSRQSTRRSRGRRR